MFHHGLHSQTPVILLLLCQITVYWFLISIQNPAAPYSGHLTFLPLPLGCKIIVWILDFLTHRSQWVWVNISLSDLYFSSTGFPFGCVLSPLLFILYNDDWRSTHPKCHLVKYADDPVLVCSSDSSSVTAVRPLITSWNRSEFVE